MPKPVAVAYIPVLHKGYYDFMKQLEQDGVTELYIVGDDILEAHVELDYINRKDRLRALPTEDMLTALTSLTKISVTELTLDQIKSLQEQDIVIVTPREDIGEVIVSKYFPRVDTKYLDVFVRRNMLNVGEDALPQVETISLDTLQSEIWNQVVSEAGKSADWWRQVGAALVKDGEVVYVTHNEHMSEAQLPNIEGDTRALFKKGIHINYVTAAHAEVVAIGRAAKEGIVTSGAELYVTDFPCPYCARLIVSAGIAKVYFLRGYAVLEGDQFLKDAGIEVVKVDI